MITGVEDAKRFVAFGLLEASGRLGSYAAAAYSEYLRMTGPGKKGTYIYIIYYMGSPLSRRSQGEETITISGKSDRGDISRDTDFSRDISDRLKEK